MAVPPRSPESDGRRQGAKRSRRDPKAPGIEVSEPAPRRPPSAPEEGDGEVAGGLSREQECELVARAQRGDEEAFAALVRAHEKRAWRVARSLVGDAEDARDLAQEAFLRVFRNIERFDFQHSFATWLHRIVTNLAIDHLRKRRPNARGGNEDGEEPEREVEDEDLEPPSASLEREETVREVHEVLEALPPHFQVVLRLRELEGMSCLEIAEIVGATHVTVRWRLHRGRKLFQEEWDRRRRWAERTAGLGLGPAGGGERNGPAADSLPDDTNAGADPIVSSDVPRGAREAPPVDENQ